VVSSEWSIPGRGIIRTADEGPTAAVNKSIADMDEPNVTFRHVPKVGATRAEKKSRDHT